MVKIGTQDQSFFPKDFKEKFQFVKDMGFEGFEIDGQVLIERFDEIKAAKEAVGIEICSACNGYTGWIGDIDTQKRRSAIQDISEILRKLSELGGTGIVVPAAWGMWSYPHYSPFPRTKEEDFAVVSDSLIQLNKVAKETNTVIYLEPLNRYQDHMINVLADSKRYILENNLSNVRIIADFYHMNQEEDDISEALESNVDYLAHVHLADNHRYLPGTGSIDFKKYLHTLQSLNYEGWLVYECLIREQNPADSYQKSIDFIKDCLR